MSNNVHGNNSSIGGGRGSGGGGGYGHHGSQSTDAHHAMSAPHHASPKAGHSYGGPALMQHMPVHHERRGRAEPRGYAPAANGGGGGPSYSEYEGSKYDLSPLPSNSYTPPGWNGDAPVSRSVGHGMMRSQSPPAMMRGAHGGRNGGGAPRPPPTPPRGYDNQYSSTRYNVASHGGNGSGGGGGGGHGGAVDGFPASLGATGRRHSGSSVMSGRNSMQLDALAASTSYYYSVGETGNEHAYDRDYSYAGPSRMA